jgi:nascent polypeptide-associated complex subunit alpha
MMPGLGGMDPRQMAMMMRKMGIQVEEIDDVTEVLVRTKKRDYRFRKASVSVMKAQGTETWQVVGKAEVIEHGDATSSTAGIPTSMPPSNAPAATPQPSNVPLSIPEEDVRLVMEQAGCDQKTARRTLEATGGDLAEALVRLGK